MKLNIGENIRRLRRDADLTQEQLADKLGVSYQSVSRWENGTTYPDMEFLPVLSSIFGVTVDELLGCGEIQRNEQLTQRIQEFEAMCASENTTPESLLPLLRELRGDCLPSAKVCEEIGCLFTRILNGNPEIKKDPAIIEELRKTAEELLSRPIPQWLHDSVVYDMAHIEDETYIGSFLKSHATQRDLSADHLLFSRYLRSGNWDKADPLRQKKLYGAVNDMVFGMMWRRHDRGDVHENIQINDLVLGFLHNLCGVTPDPDHPITGDGSVDIFVKHRLALGFRKAGCHAAMGETEKAFVALEDTVTMLETFMRLPEGSNITCKSICLKSVVMKKKRDEGDNWDVLTCYRDDVIGIGHIITKPYVLFPLTRIEGWSSFNPIRNDPRYATYVERVKAVFAPDTPANSEPTEA